MEKVVRLFSGSAPPALQGGLPAGPSVPSSETGAGGPSGDHPSQDPSNAVTSISKIMPMGDSITWGYDLEDPNSDPAPGQFSKMLFGGYRYPLFRSLTDAGYNVSFVGSQSGGPEGWAQPNNEGHPGWCISDMANGIAKSGWLNVSPDVILLQIGTNDFGACFQTNPRLGIDDGGRINADGSQDFTNWNAPTQLNNLVGQILKALPKVKIIIATIPPIQSVDVSRYNASIRVTVEQYSGQGRPVFLADINRSLLLGDLSDGVHPRQSGYAKMAEVWQQAIDNALVKPDIFFADVSGDGLVDLLVHDKVTGNLSLNLNAGGGTVGTAIASVANVNRDGSQIFLVDINGDKRSDLVVWNKKSGQISAALSTASGFGRFVALGTVGAEENELFFADITGDGNADLIVWNKTSGSITVYPVTDRKLGEPFNFGVVGSDDNQLYFSDMTGDGKSDLVVWETSSGSIKVYPSQGRTVGGPLSFGAVGPDRNQLFWADVTGDGKSDLLVWNTSSGSITAFPSTGSGLSGPLGFGNVGATGNLLYFGNAARDRMADLIVWNLTSGNISAWPSTGSNLAAPIYFDNVSAPR